MARAVFAVNCTLTVSRRVLVDAPADVDGDDGAERFTCTEHCEVCR